VAEANFGEESSMEMKLPVDAFVAGGLGGDGINARIRAVGAIMALRSGRLWQYESVKSECSNPGDDTLRWRCKLDAKR
jgi:hypothetical protein